MKLANITSAFRAKLITNAYRGWISNDQKVLDVGCGTGIVAKELQNEINIKKMVGCDIERYLLTDIDFKIMNTLNTLPFKKNSFDVAMFNDVLHHTDYENQITLIKESLRVANEVLLFELKPNLIGKIGDYILNKVHNPNMEIPFTYRGQKDWELLFSKNKIKFEKRNVKSPFWYPFTHIAYRLTKQT